MFCNKYLSAVYLITIAVILLAFFISSVVITLLNKPILNTINELLNTGVGNVIVLFFSTLLVFGASSYLIQEFYEVSHYYVDDNDFSPYIPNNNNNTNRT